MARAARTTDMILDLISEGLQLGADEADGRAAAANDSHLTLRFVPLGVTPYMTPGHPYWLFRDLAVIG